MTITFQQILHRLSQFWEEHGCIIHEGYDLEVGAGTFNPATFLRCLGPEPYRASYVEPSRRPTDGRYGLNPNRLQHYFQFQTILKPSPPDIQNLYLKSLEAIGFDLSKHDIRFVHDDWESPTLGASGLGWEVWMDGMEVTQFTYFQTCGGLALKPVTGELTYGIERLAIYLQGVSSILELQWSDDLKYGDIYRRSEEEWSAYNFEHASTEMWARHFDDFEREATLMVEKKLPLPAYDFVMKASHAFNMLDARGVISVGARTHTIARIRNIAKAVAELYVESRNNQGLPLAGKFQDVAPIETAQLPAPKSPTGDKQDFLLEIGSEELPAHFVEMGMRSLSNGLEKLFKREGLSYDRIEMYGTPRRLAAYVRGLVTATEPVTKERKGPAKEAAYDSDGRPTKAAQGFFNAIGENTPVETREIKGKEYLFATLTTPGKQTATVLADCLASVIVEIDFPKKMRWANYDMQYARPLHTIVALFGDQEIPIQVGPIISGRTTHGHRQRDKRFFDLPNAESYVERLREHMVMVDQKERRASIEAQLDAIESELGAQAVERERVLREVTHLTEWPELTHEGFDNSFLRAPKEVLVSEMVEHQRYFPLAGKDGKLIARYVITADNTPSDAIRSGNTKVLSARLSDGTFLFDQDLKESLEERNKKLADIAFFEGLGSMQDKVSRLVGHVESLHTQESLEDLKRAALLCKSDLASEMVGEFPNLQGIIGRYYAEQAGEKPEVAIAIDEHWMPRGEKAPLPSTRLGCLLSLADKFDNIIACFLMGFAPTSSGDPYALRRQVLGIVRMLLDQKMHLNLMQAFSSCYNRFPERFQEQKECILTQIEKFIVNRIKTVFAAEQIRKDEIEAIFSSGFTDVYDAYLRIKALHTFRENGGGAFDHLFEVYKRARGQVERFHRDFAPHVITKEQISIAIQDGEPDELVSLSKSVHNLREVIQELEQMSAPRDLPLERAEVALADRLGPLAKSLEEEITTQNYDAAYSQLAEVQPVLAQLFDEVKILCDDEALRQHRIFLLQRVLTLFETLLDFGKIQERR